MVQDAVLFGAFASMNAAPFTTTQVLTRARHFAFAPSHRTQLSRDNTAVLVQQRLP